MKITVQDIPSVPEERKRFLLQEAERLEEEARAEGWPVPHIRAGLSRLFEHPYPEHVSTFDRFLEISGIRALCARCHKCCTWEGEGTCRVYYKNPALCRNLGCLFYLCPAIWIRLYAVAPELGDYIDEVYYAVSPLSLPLRKFTAYLNSIAPAVRKAIADIDPEKLPYPHSLYCSSDHIRVLRLYTSLDDFLSEWGPDAEGFDLSALAWFFHQKAGR